MKLPSAILAVLFCALLLAVQPAQAARVPLPIDLAAAPGTIEGGQVALWYLLLRLVLLSGLVFAIVASFKVPGTGIPEALAAVLLAAILVPAFLAGTAQWYEILAILAGIGLLAIEVFVIPGFGATGAVGALLVLGGLTMVFVPDPRGLVPSTIDDYRNALLLLIGGLLGGTVSVVAFGRFLPNLPRARRLILNETNTGPLPAEPRLAIGDAGIALTDLRPGGVVRVALPGDDLAHRDFSVVSDRGFIAAGQAVVVADLEGNKVTVRPGGRA